MDGIIPIFFIKLVKLYDFLHDKRWILDKINEILFIT